MNRTWLFSTLVATALVTGTGCASDPNKQLEDAQKKEVEARREQREDNIDRQKENSLEATEAQKQQSDERAKALPSGTQERVEAENTMRKDRTEYDVKADARLKKVDARIDEAQKKLRLAGARAPGTLRDKVTRATTQREAVGRQLDALRSAPDAQWKDGKDALDKRLDELEKTVDETGAKVNSVEP